MMTEPNLIKRTAYRNRQSWDNDSAEIRGPESAKISN